MPKGGKGQPLRKSPRKRKAPSYQESPHQSDIEDDELEVSKYSEEQDEDPTDEEDGEEPISACLITDTTVKFNPEEEDTWILDTTGPPELNSCEVCGTSCSNRASKMRHQKESHPPLPSVDETGSVVRPKSVSRRTSCSRKEMPTTVTIARYTRKSRLVSNAHSASPHSGRGSCAAGVE